MELTDKCKEAFERYSVERSLEITNRHRTYPVTLEQLMPYKGSIWNLDPIYLQALIIEFFDLPHVDIRIGITYDGFTKKKFDAYVDDERIGYFETRFDAINAGISKGNEIYNSL